MRRAQRARSFVVEVLFSLSLFPKSISQRYKMDLNPNFITDGARVIFKRHDWCKDGVVGAGRLLVISKQKTKTDDIVGLPYGALVEWNKEIGKFERVAEEDDDDYVADVESGETGGDNRNLVDDRSAQALSAGAIAELKSTGVRGMDLVNNIVQNSSSFNQRQEYSKEKYVQKKKKKHIYRFRILQPTLRLVCEVYSSTKAQKINHLRIDTLAIMMSLSNIQAGSKVIVFDGVQGLLLAAAMERTGGRGHIVHIHPGPKPVIPAYDMFGFPESWTDSIHNLSVDNLEVLSVNVEIMQNGIEQIDIAEPPLKRRKLNDIQTAAAHFLRENQMDSLIMASRHHPKTVITLLIPLLALSKNFVIHNAFREPLVDTFQAVRSLGTVVRVCLNDTWLRYYQVLPSRTHPENNMSGAGGFLLSGTTVEKGAIVAEDSEIRDDSD